MSKEMKYEAVFGNQELFDNAPLGTELVGHSGGFYKNSPDGPIYCGGCTFTTDEYRNIGFIAARRIIRTPTWTWEDKKDGRLPDVGAEVQFNFYQSAVMRQGVIKYIDDQVAVIQTEDVTRPFCYETCKVVFTPIETPEEKADRLRSEWINKAYVDFHRLGCELEVLQKEQIKQIYDALLSGALSVPTKGGE